MKKIFAIIITFIFIAGPQKLLADVVSKYKKNYINIVHVDSSNIYKRVYGQDAESFVEWAFENKWMSGEVTIIIGEPTFFINSTDSIPGAYSDQMADGQCIIFLKGRLFHDSWKESWSEFDELVLSHELSHCKMFNVNVFKPSNKNAMSKESIYVLNKTHFSSHVGHQPAMAAISEVFADFYGISLLTAKNKKPISPKVWSELIKARAPIKNMFDGPDPYTASFLMLPKQPTSYDPYITPDKASDLAAINATKALKALIRSEEYTEFNKNDWGVGDKINMDVSVMSQRVSFSDGPIVEDWHYTLKNLYLYSSDSLKWQQYVKDYESRFNLKKASNDFWVWISSN